MVRGIVDCAGRNLRLKDWRNGLRFVRQTALYPSELRRVSAGICTMVVFTLLPSCSSSVRNEAKNPNTACFDAQ